MPCLLTIDHRFGATVNTKRADQVFDLDRFLADFQRYKKAQKLTATRVAELTGFSNSHVSHLLNVGTRRLTLFGAVVLADLADLSLDDYRREWCEQLATG